MAAGAAVAPETPKAQTGPGTGGLEKLGWAGYCFRNFKERVLADADVADVADVAGQEQLRC